MTIVGGAARSPQRELAAVLLDLGMARPYDGGKRRPWCDRDQRLITSG